METFEIMDITTNVQFAIERSMAYRGSLPIYHYTTMEALLNITKTKQLWLTDSRYLNDKAEVVNARGIIIDTINAEANNLSKVMRECIKRLQSRSWRSRKPIRTYVTSFSRKHDILSQWKGYAHSRSGVCIGFDRSSIFQSTHEGWNKPYLFKVIYSEKAKIDLIKKFLYQLDDALRENRINSKYAEIVEFTFDGFMEICSVCFKDPSWAEEAEVRLVILPNEVKLLDHREKSGFIIPFAKCKLNPAEAITSITLIDGSPLRKKSVQEYLASIDCGSVIKQSEIDMQFF
jgi:hypothetical protein